MLDIRKIKENPDAVKAGMKAKEVDCDAVIDRILELDVEIRALKTSSEGRTAQKNKIAKENGKLYGMKKGLEKKGESTADVDAKIAAAKTFIKYMCDSAATADAVKAANYFAVRDTAEGTDLSGIWADNAIMNEYNVLMPMLGDYYQVTTGWAEARTAWWNMLQAVGSGADITESVATYAAQANAAAGA